jgi:two-component system, OmpR family, response regulator
MSEKRKILLVDDDKDLCRMLEKYLTVKGSDVDVAFDGETALRMAPQKRYDLIILDIMMPGIDGYEVCQRLKIQREFNPIPILMLSAKDTEQDRIVGFKTGADAYISKPFEVPDLSRAIEETVEKCRLAREDRGVRHEISFQVQSRFSYLEQVNEMIGQLFRRTDMAPDEIWEIKLAMHELGINAIEHGNKMDPAKQVKVGCTIFDGRLEFMIEDEGEGFDFGRVPDPTDSMGVHRDRGRGIFLVGQLVDEVQYINGGSKVRMVRFLNRPRKLHDRQRPVR